MTDTGDWMVDLRDKSRAVDFVMRTVTTMPKDWEALSPTNYLIKATRWCLEWFDSGRKLEARVLFVQLLYLNPKTHDAANDEGILPQLYALYTRDELENFMLTFVV